MKRSVLIFIAVVFCVSMNLYAQDPGRSLDSMTLWVENQLQSMTLDQKIGQLFTIRAFSDGKQERKSHIEKLIRQYHVGGICFFQGTPVRQAQLTQHYQNISNIPLLISIDAEWGLEMRHKNTGMAFPRQITLGAIQSNQMIYDMGRAIGRQLKRIGIQVNFAPVVDINNNPNNPVIGDRSFGENRYDVSAKAYQYARGMEDEGIIACAKHFPGHGDTDVDSHYDLPVINHSMERLDSLELFPFKFLAGEGIRSMMIAHLQVPAIDAGVNKPTSLSKRAVDGLLRNTLGYDGLVFTDGLEMKGVTKHYNPGQVAVESIIAGNDVLLLSEDVPSAFKVLRKTIKEGKISESRIDQSVRRILKAKYLAGLNKKPEIKLIGIPRDLFKAEDLAIKQNLYESAVTLISNDHQQIPIKSATRPKICLISLGDSPAEAMADRMMRYAATDHFTVTNPMTKPPIGMLEAMEKADFLVFALADMSRSPSRKFGIKSEWLTIMKRWSSKKPSVICIFGSPYSLKYFEDIDAALVMGYESDPMMQEIVAEALFAAKGFKGRLPVSVSEKFPINKGILMTARPQLSYVLPERVGMSSDTLKKIDKLVREMIEEKVIPGCQILIARKGKVVYDKSFGFHTYERARRVQPDDIYDLASLTKILSGTASTMKLYEQGMIDVNEPISAYLEELDTTNKKDLCLYDILAHHSGLEAWIPFYKNTILQSDKATMWLMDYYRPSRGEGFDVPVADQLFLRNDYRDSIWREIICSELSDDKAYKYSDLGFYMIAEIIRRLTNQEIDEYVRNEFYNKLGLRHTYYNPLENGIHRKKIVPSEDDGYYRMQKLVGHVHDMGAAMMGGVSGHAGLFSNSYEVALMMQMFLNKGMYAHQKLLEPATVRYFTRRHRLSLRRGLGFDMKQLDPQIDPNMSHLASESTFGHLGFTGTCAWADPENELIFVFLSNRTYPSMNNKKLAVRNYRPRLHTIAYQAIIDP